MFEIPPTSSDEMKEAGIVVDTRPFTDPYAVTTMENKYEMKCWRCGKRLAPKEGRVHLKEAIPALKGRILTHKNEKWVAECATLCSDD